MSLKPCLGCQTAVDTTAKTCPKCGRPSPTKKPTSKLVWGAVAFIALFGLYRLGSHPKIAERDGEAAPVAAEDTPLPVSISELETAYNANEVSADNKYKGKRLALAGRVASIDKDFADNIKLNLASSSSFIGVPATLRDSEAGKAAALKKGQGVALVCTGSGFIMHTVTLRDCVLR